MLGRGLQSLIPPKDFSEENGTGNSGVTPIVPADPVVSTEQSASINKDVPTPTDFSPDEISILEIGSSGVSNDNQPPVPPVSSSVSAVPDKKTPENFASPASSSLDPSKESASRASFVSAPLISPSRKPEENKQVDPERNHQDAIFHIEVDKIKPNPDQPRRFFDPDGIKDLAASIREFGLLQPIVVTKVEKEVANGTEIEYVLISGERRLLASKMLGLERIPTIIRNIDLERERLELAIIENIQRENLNPIEIARSFARLQDEFRLTQREIAVRLGKSREVVANSLRLLDLPQIIQDAISRGAIQESHGRLLLAIDDPAAQERLYRDLIGNKLTTRELKTRVDAIKKRKKPAPENVDISPELKIIQQKLNEKLGAPVEIKSSGESGKITIAFYSEEELVSILQRLGAEE